MAYPIYHIADQKTASGTGTSVVINRPDNVVADNLLIVLIHNEKGSVTPPAGFTLIRTETGWSTQESAFYRIAGSSEPASYTFTLGSSELFEAVAGRVTGHHLTTTIDQHSGANTGGSSVTSITVPEIIATNPRTLLISIMGSIASQSSITVPGGMSSLYENLSSGHATGAGAEEDIANAGATGNRTWTTGDSLQLSALMFNINSIELTTHEFSDLTSTTVRLHGYLHRLQLGETVDVYFEYREYGTGPWSSTPTTTLSAAGSFQADVTNLSPDTNYEYRAAASDHENRDFYGELINFLTPLNPLVLSGELMHVNKLVRLTWEGGS